MKNAVAARIAQHEKRREFEAEAGAAAAAVVVVVVPSFHCSERKLWLKQTSLKAVIPWVSCDMQKSLEEPVKPLLDTRYSHKVRYLSCCAPLLKSTAIISSRVCALMSLSSLGARCANALVDMRVAAGYTLIEAGMPLPVTT